MVAAASDQARRFGVRSAMASVTARRKCPVLVFVPPRFDVYRAISQQIRKIFAEYTPLVEPLSLDEAYLDVTKNLKGIPSAIQIAQEIRTRIRQETGLTASAGVSYNKFLAKMASDQRKPDGLFVITPAMGPGFVETLPVGKFHGIGPATAAKMNQLGIVTGLDLKAQSLAFLQERFGKAGSYYHSIARGLDHRLVRADRIRKSLGAENTFAKDLTGFEEMKAELQPILDKVWRHCEQTGVLYILPGDLLAREERGAPAEPRREGDLGVTFGQERAADDVVEGAVVVARGGKAGHPCARSPPAAWPRAARAPP